MQLLFILTLFTAVLSVGCGDTFRASSSLTSRESDTVGPGGAVYQEVPGLIQSFYPQGSDLAGAGEFRVYGQFVAGTIVRVGGVDCAATVLSTLDPTDTVDGQYGAGASSKATCTLPGKATYGEVKVEVFLPDLIKSTAQQLFLYEDGTISAPSDLEKLRRNISRTYSVTQDIDLNGFSWSPLRYFNGTLNGNGFKFVNLTVTSSNLGVTGFVSVLQSGGRIQNLNFQNLKVDHTFAQTVNGVQHIAAGLVAFMTTGSVIEQVVVEGFTLNATDPNLLLASDRVGLIQNGATVTNVTFVPGGEWNLNTTVNFDLCAVASGAPNITATSKTAYFVGTLGNVNVNGNATIGSCGITFDNVVF